MNAPMLRATFQPHLTFDDLDLPDGPVVAFDAGRALLALSADDVRRVASQVGVRMPVHLDILAEAAGLIGSGQGRHDRLAHVTIDPADVRAFLLDLWIEDVDTLTNEDMVNVRASYAAMTDDGPTPA